MAMSLGGGSTRRPEMNVTPLIDVLLVLIIIFMVIVPLSPTGLDTRLPQEDSNEKPSSPPPPSNDVVITVQANKMVKLNQELMAVKDLSGRLKKSFSGTSSQVIFIRADRDLEYDDVAQVIDIAKGAGLRRIALMTK
jgi:biopolymer transport protein ExbD